MPRDAADPPHHDAGATAAPSRERRRVTPRRLASNGRLRALVRRRRQAPGSPLPLPSPGPRHFRELVFHLAKRELTLTHRWTLLGWAWPLTRQLAQLAVLVFVFSSVLDLGIEDFPVFVFSGLVAWSWFSSGLGKATSCLIAQRHLLFQARFPAVVLPIVAVAVPFVDVLMALPILVVMAITSSGLHASMTLLPAVVVVQLVLMAGLAWITSAVSVYVRDVPQVVLVGLTLLFYLTPVFYDASRVPEEYRWILQLNPMTTLLDLYRALLLGHPFPAVAHVVAVTALSVGVALLGYTLFKRLQPGFVDEL